jgi:hypothetical protein
MGFLVGDLEMYSTWGSFRRGLGVTLSENFGSGPHNIYQNEGFRTSAGNGFFRHDPSLGLVLGDPELGINPSNPTQFRLRDAAFRTVMDQREADQLIGSVVTGTVGSLTINADFQLADGQLTPVDFEEPITAIDKLSPFTY